MTELFATLLRGAESRDSIGTLNDRVATLLRGAMSIHESSLHDVIFKIRK